MCSTVLSLKFEKLEGTIVLDESQLRFFPGAIWYESKEELDDAAYFFHCNNGFIVNQSNFQITWNRPRVGGLSFPSMEKLFLLRDVYWHNYIEVPILPFAIFYFVFYWNMKEKHNKPLVVTVLAGPSSPFGLRRPGARAAPQL